MAGPALALEIIFLIGFFGILIFLLIFTIVNRKSLRKSIPGGILFLVLTSSCIYVYYSMLQRKYEISKKFLGDYKLGKLDKQKCENCKVKLKDDYTYDIIVNNKIVGQGRWNLETAIDIPEPFLRVENGPNYTVWETDRLIDYIDRTQYK